MPGVRKEETTEAKEDNGDESRIKGKTLDGFPDFGRNMLKYFQFAEGCESHYMGRRRLKRGLTL